MKRLVLALALGLALAAPASSVLAEKPANPDCWGTVTSQRATAVGDIGEQSSAQTEPRSGLGNFARTLFELGLTEGPHISDAGTVAAELDEIEATECPED